MQVDLKEKYPKIFANIHRANYGFPKTWTNLVNSLCHEIQKYCDTHECDQVECIQIKLRTLWKVISRTYASQF